MTWVRYWPRISPHKKTDFYHIDISPATTRVPTSKIAEIRALTRDFAV